MTRIDGFNAGMGIRAAQDLAIEHAWEANVRSVGGAARDLSYPIRADRWARKGPAWGVLMRQLNPTVWGWTTSQRSP
jgi:hypothetical protein